MTRRGCDVIIRSASALTLLLLFAKVESGPLDPDPTTTESEIVPDDISEVGEGPVPLRRPRRPAGSRRLLGSGYYEPIAGYVPTPRNCGEKHTNVPCPYLSSPLACPSETQEQANIVVGGSGGQFFHLKFDTKEHTLKLQDTVYLTGDVSAKPAGNYNCDNIYVGTESGVVYGFNWNDTLRTKIRLDWSQPLAGPVLSQVTAMDCGPLLGHIDTTNGFWKPSQCRTACSSKATDSVPQDGICGYDLNCKSDRCPMPVVYAGAMDQWSNYEISALNQSDFNNLREKFKQRTSRTEWRTSGTAFDKSFGTYASMFRSGGLLAIAEAGGGGIFVKNTLSSIKQCGNSSSEGAITIGCEPYPGEKGAYTVNELNCQDIDIKQEACMTLFPQQATAGDVGIGSDSYPPCSDLPTIYDGDLSKKACHKNSDFLGPIYGQPTLYTYKSGDTQPYFVAGTSTVLSDDGTSDQPVMAIYQVDRPTSSTGAPTTHLQDGLLFEMQSPSWSSPRRVRYTCDGGTTVDSFMAGTESGQVVCFPVQYTAQQKLTNASANLTAQCSEWPYNAALPLDVNSRIRTSVAFADPADDNDYLVGDSAKVYVVSHDGVLHCIDVCHPNSKSSRYSMGANSWSEAEVFKIGGTVYVAVADAAGYVHVVDSNCGNSSTSTMPIVLQVNTINQMYPTGPSWAALAFGIGIPVLLLIGIGLYIYNKNRAQRRALADLAAKDRQEDRESQALLNSSQNSLSRPPGLPANSTATAGAVPPARPPAPSRPQGPSEQDNPMATERGRGIPGVPSAKPPQRPPQRPPQSTPQRPPNRQRTEI